MNAPAAPFSPSLGSCTAWGHIPRPSTSLRRQGPGLESCRIGSQPRARLGDVSKRHTVTHPHCLPLRRFSLERRQGCAMYFKGLMMLEPSVLFIGLRMKAFLSTALACLLAARRENDCKSLNLTPYKLCEVRQESRQAKPARPRLKKPVVHFQALRAFAGSYVIPRKSAMVARSFSPLKSSVSRSGSGFPGFSPEKITRCAQRLDFGGAA